MAYSRQENGMGCCFLLQGIFPTQRSKPGLLNYRQILYCLSHQGSPPPCLSWSSSLPDVRTVQKSFCSFPCLQTYTAHPQVLGIGLGPMFPILRSVTYIWSMVISVKICFHDLNSCPLARFKCPSNHITELETALETVVRRWPWNGKLFSCDEGV